MSYHVKHERNSDIGRIVKAPYMVTRPIMVPAAKTIDLLRGRTTSKIGRRRLRIFFRVNMHHRRKPNMNMNRTSKICHIKAAITVT